MLQHTDLSSVLRIFRTLCARSAASIVGLALFAIAPETHGQEQEQARPELDEVLVTATKREESLQEVPISLTVLDEATLERRGVNEFFDYGSSVPNLSFGFTGDGVFTAQSIQIRGIEGASTTG